MSRGAPRRRALVDLVPDGREVIDVGADHGHVAHALGAIATERRPGRRGRGDVPWVVADGLRPFREVDVAVIAGMGAHTILGILDRGPRPRTLVAHAPDDPAALRVGLAARGWRIDAERLAREAGRFAEVLRAVPGDEPATGLALEFGPRLLASGDPLLAEHLAHQARWLQGIADATAEADPDKHAWASERAAFARAHLERWTSDTEHPPESR